MLIVTSQLKTRFRTPRHILDIHHKEGHGATATNVQHLSPTNRGAAPLGLAGTDERPHALSPTALDGLQFVAWFNNKDAQLKFSAGHLTTVAYYRLETDFDVYDDFDFGMEDDNAKPYWR